ncbi:hypothetical protein CHH56_07440, partial [Terribacillus saccharophilus]
MFTIYTDIEVITVFKYLRYKIHKTRRSYRKVCNKFFYKIFTTQVRLANYIFQLTSKLKILIKDNAIPIIIALIVIGIFSFSFYFEIINERASGFWDKDFWLDEIIPNVIADSIGIVVSTFIIASLFNYYQKRRELKVVYNFMGRSFEKLI